MIDVSDIIYDPDFVEPFQIIRVTGAFDNNGVWADVEAAPIDVQGIELPAKKDALMVLPEGERLKEAIILYSLVELKMGDNATQKSDIILYAGKYYKVAFTRYYAQVLLWYAVATRFMRD